MKTRGRTPRRSLVAALTLGLLAPVTALTSSVVEAAPIVETADAGSTVEQLSCPPGLTGPTCTDGIPQPTDAAIKVAFEATPAAAVNLGALASRSRGSAQPALIQTTIGSIYKYTHPTEGWSFESDRNYSSGGARYESQVTATIGSTSRTIENKEFNGITIENTVKLTNSASCAGGYDPDAYCSAFGPEVWTEPFNARQGDFLAFQFGAVRGSDDYEIYAFLVEVTDADYASGDHTVLAHARGGTQPWKTVTGSIPETGRYRFRFVNGTFDFSDGGALGSQMWIDPTIWVGRNNYITMDDITDKFRGTSPETFKISARAVSDGLVSFLALPAGRCTVSASTRLNDGSSEALLTIPSTATNGGCTVYASTPQFGPYVPAPALVKAFNVCNTAPSHGGGQGLSGSAVEGQRLEVADGTINSCGDNYVRTYQWQVCNQLPCTLDAHFSDFGNPSSLRGFGPDKDQKGVLSLTSALEGKRLRAKITVTSPAGSFTVATAASEPVVALPKQSDRGDRGPVGDTGPVSEPKPFVLPSGDTPRATPGEIVVYEGGAPVVVTSQPVTVNGVQSVRLGGTSAGGGKFEMTIGGDCPTCAVTQENDGKNVLGMEQAAAVRVGGYGFGPASQVNVFVSSTTRLIGFFKADGDGAFLGSVKVPTDLPRGNHTIQVSGFTADNVIRSVSVGITVERATPKACRVVKRKGKKPVTVCPKAKKAVKKKK